MSALVEPVSSPSVGAPLTTTFVENVTTTSMTEPILYRPSAAVLLTPVTYLVVGFLKQREGIDVFDQGTDFSPFRTRV